MSKHIGFDFAHRSPKEGGCEITVRSGDDTILRLGGTVCNIASVREHDGRRFGSGSTLPAEILPYAERFLVDHYTEGLLSGKSSSVRVDARSGLERRAPDLAGVSLKSALHNVLNRDHAAALVEDTQRGLAAGAALLTGSEPAPFAAQPQTVAGTVPGMQS